jgi:hypothetical protein
MADFVLSSLVWGIISLAGVLFFALLGSSATKSVGDAIGISAVLCVVMVGSGLIFDPGFLPGDKEPAFVGLVW